MRHLKIYLVLLAAFIAQLFFVFKEHPIWWDSSIYLGMGHYIYSLGAVGIWEPIRPLVWPLLLGFFWKTGLNDIFMGYVLGIIFSLGSVFVAYHIGKKLHNEDAGLIAALILAFTPVFFESFFMNLTELPSIFFALLAVYLFLDKKHLMAGAFAGISFLTKFPNGILIAILVIIALIYFKAKDAGKIFAGSLVVIIPYLVFNYIMYGNILNVFIEADAIVKNAGTWLFSGPWYYYIIELLKQNPLYVLALVGAYELITRKKYIIPALGFLFLAYFSIHVHKEIRFGILMLPYIAVMAGFGIKSLFKQKWIILPVLFVVLTVFAFNLPSDYGLSNEAEGYLSFLEGKDVEGEVLTMQPAVNLYSSKAVIPMYYPVFNAELADKWIDYIKKDANKISYVFIDTCEGGMVCAPEDSICNEKKEELAMFLKETFNIAYYAERETCEYYVFESL
ncbi:MAG: glycosyltransferase family 39 protein [Nanoarchaeota archaeon]|nr:glycosyltransferase family 39 protein [Nanoarchaeota archaeon]